MKIRIIAVLLAAFAVIFCLASCGAENEKLTEAKNAWSKIASSDEVKNTVGYVEGWFYDNDASLFKYHIGKDATVVTADGKTFELKEYDGSDPSRYEVKESGSGDTVKFPEIKSN